ncbi:MotA/TolQ/ExbB proton channel family protein [Zavarzinella formosa]|uniref:MotA/TolQ/ExbB proton channel family protein n=1 Tax=Zavarzinella formosa TaxID=360055 RepID=UPI0002F50F95|nr:MotA/TolQ/ExbB proton channel family protein [Zavarzinella formosa]
MLMLIAQTTNIVQQAAAAQQQNADNSHLGALGYMIDGGYFMWPILFMAILGAGVVIERWRSLRLVGTDGAKLRADVIQMLHDDKLEEALALCARSTGPVPAILSVGLHRYEVLRRLNYDPARIEEQVVKAMDDYGVHITAALERNLPILATIANVAPMVGSVGTVVGMVVLFQDLTAPLQYGETILNKAAKGIKVKLIVTVWGLLVGIPAYIFYNYFSTAVNRYILEAEETASQLVEALTIRLATQEATSSGEGRIHHAPTSKTGVP